MTLFENRVMRSLMLMIFSLFILAACKGDVDDSNSQVLAKAVSVRLATAETRDVQQEFYSIGRLVSKNNPLLAAEINARVVEVLVDEGDRVEQDQVLVRLDTTAAALARREAQAAIQGLQVSIANEERRVKRYRDLQTRDVLPQERLDDAEAKLASDRAAMNAAQARLAIAEDHLARAELRSPFSGVVEQRHVSIGDFVKVGSPVMMVTDTLNLRAELPFPETVAHHIQEGQELLLESPIAPGRVIEARVDQIRPQVGLMNRALIVMADVENPGEWRPEATVEGTVIVESRSGAVVVPNIAVVQRPAGSVVYTVETAGSGQAYERVIETGQRQNGWIEVVSGLEAGEIVVSEGAHYLSDGAAIVDRSSET